MKTIHPLTPLFAFLILCQPLFSQDIDTENKRKIKTVTESRLVYRQKGKLYAADPYREEFFADEIFGYMRIWFNRLDVDTVHYFKRFDQAGNLLEAYHINESGDTSSHRLVVYEKDEQGRDIKISFFNLDDSLPQKSREELTVYHSSATVTYSFYFSGTGGTLFSDSVVYNKEGKKTAKYHLDSGTWCLQAYFTYDEQGRISKEEHYQCQGVYRLAEDLCYEYMDDGRSRVEKHEYRLDSGQLMAFSHTRIFDAAGNLLYNRSLAPDYKVTEHREYDFDPLGRISEERSYSGNELFSVVRYFYKDQKIWKVVSENRDMKTFDIESYSYTQKGYHITATKRLKQPYVFSFKHSDTFYKYWEKYRLNGRRTEVVTRDFKGILIEKKKIGYDYGYWSSTWYTYTFYH